VPITSRSSASRSSIGRSDNAATGARRNAAAVRTKIHSVIVIARMIVRALQIAQDVTTGGSFEAGVIEPVPVHIRQIIVLVVDAPGRTLRKAGPMVRILFPPPASPYLPKPNISDTAAPEAP
jgi:hypothetical protein